jgi:hypothetical protein
MAGSYNHAVNRNLGGQLRNWYNMTIATETQGDAYETIEELFGMVWYLANGDAQRVEEARQHFEDGLLLSPGKEPEHLRYEEEDDQ